MNIIPSAWTERRRMAALIFKLSLGGVSTGEIRILACILAQPSGAATHVEIIDYLAAHGHPVTKQAIWQWIAKLLKKQLIHRAKRQGKTITGRTQRLYHYSTSL